MNSFPQGRNQIGKNLEGRLVGILGGNLQPGRIRQVGLLKHTFHRRLILLVFPVSLQNRVGDPPGRDRVALQSGQPGRLFLLGNLQEKLENDGASIPHLSFESPHVRIGLLQILRSEGIIDLSVQEASVPTAVENRHAFRGRRPPPEAPQKGAELFVPTGGCDTGHLETSRIQRLDHLVDDGALPRSAQTLDHNEYGDPEFTTLPLQVGQLLRLFLDFPEYGFLGLAWLPIG